jgi:hypothetical protein
MREPTQRSGIAFTPWSGAFYGARWGRETTSKTRFRRSSFVFIETVRSCVTHRRCAAFYGITLRVAASELRSRRIRGWLRLTPDGVIDDRAAPHVDADARSGQRLYAILDRLDTQSRLAFVLHQVEGMELLEVASALGVSLATVKRRLARVSARVWAMAQGDRMLVDYLEGHVPASVEKVR